MAKTDVLSLAILGMLAEQPLHGYQIRKRLGNELGPFRALSYGSLYPCLKRMVADGLLTLAEDDGDGRGSRRSRIAYSLTDAGKAQLEGELASAGAHAWDDDAFDVRFSMFGKTDSATFTVEVAGPLPTQEWAIDLSVRFAGKIKYKY